MIRKWTVGMFFLLALATAHQAYAQFTAEEIAQRPFWEEFLKTAEIIRAEEIGEGVTKPLRLYLRKDGTEARGAWKNPRGIQQGFLEGWQYEIAAYEIDKLIGLNMVPPYVEREFNGKPGALSLWVTSQYSLLQIMEQKIEIPKEVQAQVDDMKYLTRAWDSLIANDDRTQQNILYKKDWRTIIFDHSRAFRSTKEHTERLMNGKNGLKKFADGRPILFRRLPRSFVEAVKKLTFQSIKGAVGPYLTDKEIEAIMKRKTLLLAEIVEMIKESGEAKVLY
ncbi:MAG: hypothetical protein QHH14_10800 [Clostridiales bacterium]|nr:hypothetical protein [Clostridiales bacterium]